MASVHFKSEYPCCVEPFEGQSPLTALPVRRFPMDFTLSARTGRGRKSCCIVLHLPAIEPHEDG